MVRQPVGLSLSPLLHMLRRTTRARRRVYMQQLPYSYAVHTSQIIYREPNG